MSFNGYDLFPAGVSRMLLTSGDLYTAPRATMQTNFADASIKQDEQHIQKMVSLSEFIAANGCADPWFPD